MRDFSVLCTFRFLCDRGWDDLQEIDGEDSVRYCSGCAKPVFLCGSYADVAKNVAASHCVAIPSPNAIKLHLLGDVLLDDVKF